MHVVAPLRLNCPAAQGTCVELVEPGGQKYPAAHGPSHEELTWPPADPYRPACFDKGRVHNAAGQLSNGILESVCTRRRKKRATTARRHACLTWQTPVQLGSRRPLEEPYNPGAHSLQKQKGMPHRSGGCARRGHLANHLPHKPHAAKVHVRARYCHQVAPWCTNNGGSCGCR